MRSHAWLEIPIVDLSTLYLGKNPTPSGGSYEEGSTSKYGAFVKIF
jgi:hypothetical protein